MQWWREKRRYSIRLMWTALVVAMFCFMMAAGFASGIDNKCTKENFDFSNSAVLSTLKGGGAHINSDDYSKGDSTLIFVIAGLLGLTQTLIGYIYITGQNSTRRDIGALKESNDKSAADLKKSVEDLYNRKLDITVHDRVCAVLQHMSNINKNHEAGG